MSDAGPEAAHPQIVLSGAYVRLEPLSRSHIPALVAAAREDPSLYQWSGVPQGVMEMAQYVDSALAAADTVPFATVRLADGAVVGSTRFFALEKWAWPAGHTRIGPAGPDACEIGYTWLSGSAVRTPVNTEAKLLMLGHAFDTWGVHRVCFHTDVRNERSRAALARVGATFEGVLRAHRLAVDLTPRDSARFSIIAAEWGSVKRRLAQFLSERAAAS